MKEELSPETKADAKEASSAVETFVSCQLFLGNYGYPLKDYPHCEPPELPKWAFDFVDENLKENIKRRNRISWAQGKLKILADMLDDRDQKFFADELRTVVEKIGN